MGLFISSSLSINDFGYYFFDTHMNYDMSNGRSFSQNPINTINSGAFDLRSFWHFGASTLPFLLRLDNFITPFESSYLGVRILLSYIVLEIFNFIRSKLSINIPFFFLVFFPLMPYNATHNLVSTFAPSFIMGHSGNVALVIMLLGFGFLALSKIKWLISSLLILLIVKASHFLVLFGGIFLFFLKIGSTRKIFTHLAPIFFIFLFTYFFYFVHSHQHNLWILFPWPVFTSIQIYGLSWLIFSTPIVVIFLSLCFIMVYLYFFPKNNSYSIIAANSIGLSGLIGSFLLTEVSESNAIFFILACAPFITITLLANFFTIFKCRKKYIIHTPIYLICFVHVSILSINYANNFIKANYNLNLKKIVKLSLNEENNHSIKPYYAPQNSYQFIKDINFSSLFSKIKQKFGDYENKRKVISPDLSFEFVRAYSWLNKHSQKNSIMFNPSYYLFDGCPETLNSFGHNHDERHLLSNVPSYLGRWKLLGTVMSDDMDERFLTLLIISEKIVEKSQTSSEIDNCIKKIEHENKLAMKLSSIRNEKIVNFPVNWIHILSGKKEWYLVNKTEILTKNIIRNYNLKNYDELTDKKFLNNLVGKSLYVILENDDLPKGFLKKKNAVYSSEKFRIFFFSNKDLDQLINYTPRSLK